VSLSLRALVLASSLAVLLCGCNAWQTRAEFAPPQSRWTTSGTSPVAANAPPPPIAEQYCYRTLATVDCFTAPEPSRITGFTGLYPDPASLPPGSKVTN
jgi:hypothetical protein